MHKPLLTHLLVGGSGLLVLLLVLGVPLTTALPYALVLACPLMMLLMIREMHGGHGAANPASSNNRVSRESETTGRVP